MGSCSLLGVRRRFWIADEFETAGLHRHRDNDDWLAPDPDDLGR
jgi:hypothetical protein